MIVGKHGSERLGISSAAARWEHCGIPRNHQLEERQSSSIASKAQRIRTMERMEGCRLFGCKVWASSGLLFSRGDGGMGWELTLTVFSSENDISGLPLMCMMRPKSGYCA